MTWHPFRHFGLKVLALTLGTILWMTVSGEHVVERTFPVPLEFRNIPESLVITGDSLDTVDVRLRATSGQLSRLNLNDVTAFVDLTDVRPGLRLFMLRTDQVRVPFGVDVTYVFPPTVALQLEKAGEAMVPVEAEIEGQPAPGYVRGTVTVDPVEVAVVGPTGRLQLLRSAITESVSIEGATSTVTRTVGIGVADGALRLREPRNGRVTVTILPKSEGRSGKQ